MAAGPSLDEEVQLRRFVLPGLFVLALFIALWVRRPAPEIPKWDFVGEAFGTSYSVQVLVEEAPSSKEAVDLAISAQIERVNTHVSTYHEDSELSKLNRS